MKVAQSLLLCLVSVLTQSGGLAQPDDLARKSQRAKELMAEGKFVQAIPLYREIIQAVPNNPGLMLNLGMALHMAGKEREAIPELEAATKLDPTLAPAWLFLGAARLQLGGATNLFPAAPSMTCRRLLQSPRIGWPWWPRHASASSNSRAPFISIGRRLRRCRRCAACTRLWRKSIARPHIRTGRARKRRKSAGFLRWIAVLRRWSAISGRGSTVGLLPQRTAGTQRSRITGARAPTTSWRSGLSLAWAS